MVASKIHLIGTPSGLARIRSRMIKHIVMLIDGLKILDAVVLTRVVLVI